MWLFQSDKSRTRRRFESWLRRMYVEIENYKSSTTDVANLAGLDLMRDWLIAGSAAASAAVLGFRPLKQVWGQGSDLQARQLAVTLAFHVALPWFYYYYDVISNEEAGETFRWISLHGGLEPTDDGVQLFIKIYEQYKYEQTAKLEDPNGVTGISNHFAVMAEMSIEDLVKNYDFDNAGALEFFVRWRRLVDELWEFKKAEKVLTESGVKAYGSRPMTSMWMLCHQALEACGAPSKIAWHELKVPIKSAMESVSVIPSLLPSLGGEGMPNYFALWGPLSDGVRYTIRAYCERVGRPIPEAESIAGALHELSLNIAPSQRRRKPRSRPMR